jgi:hypothetical protein
MTLKNDAKISLFPDLKGPTNRSVTAWAEQNKEYLQDGPLLIVDNLKGHYGADFMNLMSDYGVTVKHLPAGSGKLLNPCDNSLHSTFRRNYLQKEKQPHTTKMESIVEAYEEIDELSIIHCFQNCGYISSRCAAHLISNLVSEGYRSTGARAAQHADWLHRYSTWKLNLRTQARNISADHFCNTTTMSN